MTHRIVGVGPSIVDVAARLPDDVWRRCLTVVGAEPGDWYQIDQPTARSLLDLVLGVGVADLRSLRNAVLPPDVTLRPGSTIANELLAMPRDTSLRRTFVSAVAVRSGVLDRLSRFFTEAIGAAGITHQSTPVEGYNPVVFVLGSHANAERTLAMYPGVSGALAQVDLAPLAPDLVLVDAYNLGATRLGALLDRIITSRAYRVLLSLGNHTVLGGPLAAQIRGYVDGGHLYVLCGNVREYVTLYPEVADVGGTVDALLDRVSDRVRYALLTDGDRGMVAHWDGPRVATPAVPVGREKMVNTAGAGDAAAGVFAAGIVLGAGRRETLRQAAHAAARALSRL